MAREARRRENEHRPTFQVPMKREMVPADLASLASRSSCHVPRIQRHHQQQQSRSRETLRQTAASNAEQIDQKCAPGP